MRKRVLAALPGCLATVMVLGCVDQPTTSSTGGLSFEEFQARAFREPGTGLYIIDWDLPVAGDDALYEIWAATRQGALAVHTQNGIDVRWSEAQKRNLTYCVSNNFGANKQRVVDAMRQASDDGWEKFADVNFVYVPAQDGACTASNPNVVFDVNPVNAGGEYVMRAFFPNSPRSLRNLLIDSSAFSPGGTGSTPFENIVAHELGHALGFRHEHTRPESGAVDCYEDNQYRGLTPYDAASVMHYPQCNGTSESLAFTTRDQEGVRALYGAPVINMAPSAQVMTPADGATVGPSFTVVASVVDTDLVRAELRIDGALVGSLTVAPFSFEVSGLSTGPHELELTAIDSANQTATRTITVTVANAGGGTGSGDGSAPVDFDNTVYGGCSAAGGGSGALVLVALIGLARRRRG